VVVISVAYAWVIYDRVCRQCICSCCGDEGKDWSSGITEEEYCWSHVDHCAGRLSVADDYSTGDPYVESVLLIDEICCVVASLECYNSRGYVESHSVELSGCDVGRCDSLAFVDYAHQVDFA